MAEETPTLAENGEISTPPVAPVAPTPDVPTDLPDASQEADDKEWDDATDELFPGLKAGKKEEDKEDEPTEPKKGDEKKPTDKKSAKKDESKEDPDKPAEKSGEENEDIPEEPDTSARDTRLAAREASKQVEAVKTDIRAKMFANVPQVLQDSDGDPIRGIDDVVKLINPRTSEPFTEEEAGMWLLSAQQQFNQNIASVEKQIEQIAEVNVDLKDQADLVTYNYGELLKAMPELRDEIWADYEATLIKDPETNIIIKAPISLARFYERNLKPYADVAKKLEAEEAAGDEDKTDEDDKPKVDPVKVEADTKAARDKKRKDRSDIFGGGDKDNDDPEDKEWGEAAETVFGPKVNKK